MSLRRNPSETAEIPSTRKLLLTVAAAIAVASVILVTTILPAEYGIDPLGTGRMLGLTAIAEPVAETGPPLAANAALVPTQQGPIGAYPAEFKADSVELVIDPYQYVEYKYRLEKGATMLYAWTATSAPLYDFHADPDGDPKPEPVSFDKTPTSGATGTFTAPFSGIHGWFFENPGGEPLTVKITTAGFYSAATEFRSPRLRRSHELTPIDKLMFQK